MILYNFLICNTLHFILFYFNAVRLLFFSPTVHRVLRNEKYCCRPAGNYSNTIQSGQPLKTSSSPRRVQLDKAASWSCMPHKRSSRHARLSVFKTELIFKNAWARLSWLKSYFSRPRSRRRCNIYIGVMQYANESFNVHNDRANLLSLPLQLHNDWFDTFH